MLSQECLSLNCFLAKASPIVTQSRAAQTREGEISPVCVFMRVCVHTCPACQRTRHSLRRRPHWTTVTDLDPLPRLSCVWGPDSERTSYAEPRSHRTWAWNHRTISGVSLQTLSLSSWCHHTWWKMCPCRSERQRGHFYQMVGKLDVC